MEGTAPAGSELDDDLIRYLLATSDERARVFGDLYERMVELCGWPR